MAATPQDALATLKRVAAACGLSVAEYTRQHPAGARLLSKVIDPEALVKDFLKRDDVKAALLVKTEQDLDTARQARLLIELVMAAAGKLLPFIL